MAARTLRKVHTPKKRKSNGTTATNESPGGLLTPSLDLRKRLLLSQPVFARLLGISVRTLATLESGTSPTDAIGRRLIELSRLTEALEEVTTSDALGRWLQTPCLALGGLKPLEVIERGEGDRIWEMIYFLRSGVPA